MRVDSLEQQLATTQNIQSIILTTLTSSNSSNSSSNNNANSNNSNNNFINGSNINALQTLGVNANNLTAALPQLQNQQRANFTGTPTQQLPNNYYLWPSNAVGNINNSNNTNNGMNGNLNALNNVNVLNNNNNSNNSGVSGSVSNGNGLLNTNQILLSQLTPSASHHSSIATANNNINTNNNINSLSGKLDEAAILAAAKQL